VLSFDRLLSDARDLKALYLTAGYSPRLGPWLSAEQTQTLAQVPLLVVQDLTPSPISAAARYALPAATFAEKDGCYVNHAGLAQALHWAVKPGSLGRTDGQIFLYLPGAARLDPGEDAAPGDGPRTAVFCTAGQRRPGRIRREAGMKLPRCPRFPNSVWERKSGNSVSREAP